MSLGAERLFGFRLKAAPHAWSAQLRLGHGSLCVMENACQFLYKHSLLPEKGTAGVRVNLTFRSKRPVRSTPAATGGAASTVTTSSAAPLYRAGDVVVVEEEEHDDDGAPDKEVDKTDGDDQPRTTAATTPITRMEVDETATAATAERTKGHVLSRVLQDTR